MAEAQQSISSAEFAEWMAYDTIDPFGAQRHDLDAAIIAAVIANVNRDTKKRSKPYEPADFLPSFDPPEQREQTVPQQLKLIEMLNAAMRGKDLRPGKGKPNGNTDDTRRQTAG